MVYVAFKDLPGSVQLALAGEFGIKGGTVGVIASTGQILNSVADDGCRAVNCYVNLETGERKTMRGSWGGPNAFERRPVEEADRSGIPFPIAPNGALAIGHDGYKPWCQVYVHPSNVALALTAPLPDLSRDERIVLCVTAGIRSSYRREEARRSNPSIDYDGVTRALATRGFVKIAKNGASTITVDGRNVAAQLREEREAVR